MGAVCLELLWPTDLLYLLYFPFYLLFRCCSFIIFQAAYIMFGFGELSLPPPHTPELKLSHLAATWATERRDEKEAHPMCSRRRQNCSGVKRKRMSVLLGNPHSCWVDDVNPPTAHLRGGVSTVHTHTQREQHTTPLYYQTESKIQQRSTTSGSNSVVVLIHTRSLSNSVSLS